VPTKPHPAPPTDFGATRLHTTRRTRAWYRVHQLSRAPLFFGKGGSNRFDAPAGEFGVLYVGADAHCAFIETFGHTTGVRSVTMGELSVRGIAVITSARPLRLLDLTGKGLARIGADARLASGDDYGLSQRWSKAIHEHPSQPDGILYRARHDPNRLSAAIFERVGPELTAVPAGSFLFPGNVALLGRILDDYRFGLIP
jgi:hypothetical protein